MHSAFQVQQDISLAVIQQERFVLSQSLRGPNRPIDMRVRMARWNPRTLGCDTNQQRSPKAGHSDAAVNKRMMI